MKNEKDEKLEIIITNDANAEALKGYKPYAMIISQDVETRKLYDISIKRMGERTGIAIIGSHMIGTSAVLAPRVMVEMEWKKEDFLCFTSVKKQEKGKLDVQDFLDVHRPYTPVLKLPKIEDEALQHLKQAFVEGIDISVLRHVVHRIDEPDLKSLAKRVVELSVRRIEELRYEIFEEPRSLPKFRQYAPVNKWQGKHWNPGKRGTGRRNPYR